MAFYKKSYSKKFKLSHQLAKTPLIFMSNSYLTRARLKGYRNIRDTEATFENGLNIIIGPNGCGKSNFLWLLNNISNDITNDLEISGDLETVILGNLLQTTITSRINEEDSFRIVKDIIHSIIKNTNDSTEHFISKEYLMYDAYLTFSIPSEIECFSTSNTISLSTYNQGIGYRVLSSSNNPIIERLTNFIFFSKDGITIQNFNVVPKYIDTIKKYTPIQDIRVEYPMREDEITMEKTTYGSKIIISNLMYGFKTNNSWFKWNELSDGTRRIVWIVLNILATNRAVLLEEPELGIHPNQLQLLMQFLKEQSAEKQIIITTHSPEVLNILDENELNRIKLARYDETLKSTVIENLSDKKQAAIKRYFAKTGLLSSYWLNIGLENKK